MNIQDLPYIYEQNFNSIRVHERLQVDTKGQHFDNRLASNNPYTFRQALRFTQCNY